MKRLSNYDEYQQSIPRSKGLSSVDPVWPGSPSQSYVSREELLELQASLEQKIDAQLKVMEQLLKEVRVMGTLIIGIIGDTQGITGDDLEGES